MKSLFSLEQYTKIFPRLKRKLSESSHFGKKLIESRKLRKFYGKCSQKYLQAFSKKSYCPSQTSLSFFRLLESRLDVVLYRAHFFETIASAKQQIRIGRIEVNNKKVISSGYNVLPGDIIRVLPQCKKTAHIGIDSKEDATSGASFKATQKRFTKKIGLPEGQWRFQRSPFLLSIFAAQFKKAVSTNALSIDNDNSVAIFKTKAIGKSFLHRLSKLSFKEFHLANLLKKWCFRNLFLFEILSTLRKFSTKKGVKKSLIEQENFDNVTSPSLRSLLPKALPEENIEKGSVSHSTNKQKTDFFKHNFLSDLQKIKINNSLSANYQLSKIEDSSRVISKHLLENDNLFSSSKKTSQISHWLFLSFVLFLKKHVISTKKKSFCFFTQKKQPFFKKQFFFKAKKTKPLHLEISYRSRLIVFLFPPQRVCFPSFIDLSQIYK